MSFEGKGLSELYSKGSLSASSTSNTDKNGSNSGKRSRFDQVEEYGRDSRKDDSSNNNSREPSSRRRDEYESSGGDGGYRRRSNEEEDDGYRRREYESKRSRDNESDSRRSKDNESDSRRSRDIESDSRRSRDNDRESKSSTSRDYDRGHSTREHDKGYSSRDKEYDYESGGSGKKGDYGRSSSRYSDRRDDRSHRDYDRSDRGGSSGRHYSNRTEIAFDRFLRLSPWRGPVTPLEERTRHLKNWDAAPAGFERISADKAKLTGLFPPPGNITKTSNYVPPTLDPARAAMFQLLNKDGVISTNLEANALSCAAASTATNSSANLPANLAKQARRFYVGNLPYNFNESALQSFLETNLRGLASSSAAAESKIVGINVSSDRSYAFVDCKTLEDASLAMTLDGVIYEGSQLKIRRPKEYHLALTNGLLNNNNNNSNNISNNINTNAANNATSTPTTVSPTSVSASLASSKRLLVISGIPECLAAEHVKSLLLMVTDLRFFLLLKDRESDKSLGVAVFEFVEDCEGEDWSGPFLRHSQGSLFMGPFEMKIQRVDSLLNEVESESESESENGELRNLLSTFNLLPGYATAPSSTTVLQLLNIVTRDSLKLDFQAIHDDLRQELEKFVTSPESESFELFIPHSGNVEEDPSKPSKIVPGIGKVFAKFGTVEEAAKAASELAGRIFDGRTCIVSFYPPDKFEKRIF